MLSALRSIIHNATLIKVWGYICKSVHWFIIVLVIGVAEPSHYHYTCDDLLSIDPAEQTSVKCEYKCKKIIEKWNWIDYFENVVYILWAILSLSQCVKRLAQIPPFPYFLKFSALSKQTLAIEYNVYIWQVSPQLSCGDTCQIWMEFEETKR